MPIATKARKKAKAKAPTNVVLTAETLDQVAESIINKIKVPREVATVVKWVKRQKKMILKNFSAVIENIDHVEGDEALMNICNAMQPITRQIGEGYRLPWQRSFEFLRAKGGSMDQDTVVKLQLRGLIKNFVKVTYTGKDNSIVVETDDCWARDICFGPFRITYWIDTGHLRLKALEPTCPQGIKSMVHPHVDRQDGAICLGEGGNAFSKSMREHRINDALLIAKGVLNQYGAGPYHNIANWTKSVAAQSCATCGDTNTTVQCCGCRRSLCKKHAFTCTRCGRSVCAEHVRKCRDCGHQLCGPCRRHEKTCGKCGKKTSDKWIADVEKFKKIVPKHASGKKKARSDKERLGGGFIK